MLQEQIYRGLILEVISTFEIEYFKAILLESCVFLLAFTGYHALTMIEFCITIELYDDKFTGSLEFGALLLIG